MEWRGRGGARSVFSHALDGHLARRTHALLGGRAQPIAADARAGSPSPTGPH